MELQKMLQKYAYTQCDTMCEGSEWQESMLTRYTVLLTLVGNRPYVDPITIN